MYHEVGTVDREGVYIKAEIRERNGKDELSVCADIRRSGHCVGGGQAIDTVLRVATHGTPTPAFKNGRIRKLVRIWRRWHLNGMRAGCEHQREAGWDKVPIDPTRPLNAYDTFAGRIPSWNMATWVRRSDHPAGLMCEPCWVCDYKYGTAWLHEELPDEVREFVAELNA